MPRNSPTLDPGSPPESSARERIVNQARKHFFAHGFRTVTMDDLAKELGMSKKTLYAHFPSKTALLEAVFQVKFQQIEAELRQITSANPADFAVALHQLLAVLQRHTDEIQPPFIRDIRRETPELFQIVQQRRAELIQRYFGQLLSEGREQGIIRKDIPTSFIIEVLLAVVQGIINPPKMMELALTPKDAFFSILSIVLEGVITKEGRAKL